MPKLSRRLSAIANLVSTDKKHDSLWDICCDHGELAFEILRRRDVPNINLVDRVQSICEGLTEKIEATDIPYGYTLKVFCEDATQIKRTFFKSTIVVAGIGENTAIEILKQYEFMDDCELILSIHSDNYDLRAYLEERGFKVLNESIVEDKGKFYEVLKLSLEQGEMITDVGKSMWSPENPSSLKYLDRKISYLENKLSHQKDDKTKFILSTLTEIRDKLR